jgi:hypothetical protein
LNQNKKYNGWTRTRGRVVNLGEAEQLDPVKRHDNCFYPKGTIPGIGLVVQQLDLPRGTLAGPS